MNTFQLSCFLAVANSLSFAKAAEQMSVSQPAITHQIKTLENELNVKLFNRSTRVVELTLEGRAFIADAKSMVTIAEQAKLRFRDPEDRPISFFSLGCGSYNQLALLTESLNELSEAVENLHPRLHVVPHDQMFHLLDTEVLDVVFSIREEAALKNDVTFRELAQSSIVCVCRGDHPLAGYEMVSLETLKEEPLIFCDPLNSSPDIVKTQWRLAEGRSPADIHFCSSADASLVLARAGFGAAILPELLVPPGNDLAKVALEEAPRISFGLFYKPHPGDSIIKKFVQITRQRFGSPGADESTDFREEQKNDP